MPCFPITTNLMSSLKVSMYCLLLEFENLIKNRLICTLLWSFDGPELPESAFSLDTARYLNFYFFNSTFFIYIHQVINLDGFLPEVDWSFLNIFKYDLYIGLGILRGQKWPKLC